MRRTVRALGGLAICLLLTAISAGQAPSTQPQVRERALIPPRQVTAAWWPKDGQAAGLTRAALDYVKSREPADKGDFRFCVVGDTNNPGLHSSGMIRPISRVFSAVIEEANKLNPDFILQVGDQAYVGLPWEFEGTLDAYARSKAPILTVPGNHDKQANTKAYERIFGPVPYTFDYGGVRFVMLDRTYHIDQKTMDWLDQALAVDGPKVVVMHIPPYIDYYPGPVGMLGATSIEGKDKKTDAFKALIARRKVDIVFMGHIHCYDRHESDGVRWIICAQAHGSRYASLNVMPGVWLPREIRVDRKGHTQTVPHFVEVRVEKGKLVDQAHFLLELNKLDDELKLQPVPADGEVPEFWWRWWSPTPASLPADTQPGRAN